jgi:hypothetical protein
MSLSLIAHFASVAVREESMAWRNAMTAGLATACPVFRAARLRRRFWVAQLCRRLPAA